MGLTKNEQTLNNNNMNYDNITRCPDCNLISSLNLLEEYMKKYNNYSLLKEKCQECNKYQNEVKGDYLYCCKCNKLLCYLCNLNHPNNDKHNTINFKRYDSLCKIHSNFFYCYCSKCKKNICIYCKPSHESHDLTLYYY